MVLKTDQCRWREAFKAVGDCVDDHVADEALLAGFGFDVDETDAWKALALGGLVVVAEKLVAATHREHRRARLHRAL